MAHTALEFVREGDVLVVTKPDRLARSARNVLDSVDDLEKRGIAVIVLSMGGARGEASRGSGVQPALRSHHRLASTTVESRRSFCGRPTSPILLQTRCPLTAPS